MCPNKLQIIPYIVESFTISCSSRSSALLSFFFFLFLRFIYTFQGNATTGQIFKRAPSKKAKTRRLENKPFHHHHQVLVCLYMYMYIQDDITISNNKTAGTVQPPDPRIYKCNMNQLRGPWLGWFRKPVETRQKGLIKARHVWLHAKQKKKKKKSESRKYLRCPFPSAFLHDRSTSGSKREGLGRRDTLWKPNMFYCCAGRRSAIPSLKNGHLYGDLTTGNKEFPPAAELLLILAPLLTNFPFCFGWVGFVWSQNFIRSKEKPSLLALHLLGFITQPTTQNLTRLELLELRDTEPRKLRQPINRILWSGRPLSMIPTSQTIVITVQEIRSITVRLFGRMTHASNIRSLLFWSAIRRIGYPFFLIIRFVCLIQILPAWVSEAAIVFYRIQDRCCPCPCYCCDFGGCYISWYIHSRRECSAGAI